MTLSIYFVVSRCKPLLTIGLMSVFLLVQVADTLPVARSIRNTLVNNRHLALTQHELESIPFESKAIIAIPPFQCSIGRSPGGLRSYEIIGYAAAQLDIPSNNFYAARTLQEQRDYHCDMQRLLNNISTDYTYFVYRSVYNNFHMLFDKKFSCIKSESMSNAFICVPK